ncbi:MAG TPA: hypothetical protein VJQ51_12630 [Burkholderiales bacterium]|nr:hypothetical protein [Burkholderiales bacterium]
MNPVNSVYSAFLRCCALALLLALAGCGIVNWSISNGSDGCPRDTKSTVPCS